MSESMEAEVRAWCRAYVARATRQAPERIDEAAPLTEAGMDSAELLFMVSALEERFGLELASDTTTEHPSVVALGRFIAARLR